MVGDNEKEITLQSELAEIMYGQRCTSIQHYIGGRMNLTFKYFVYQENIKKYNN